jgi:isoleucyl-tRNA synthetase
MMQELVRSVPDSFNFPQEEENILKFWLEKEIFAKCLKQSAGKSRYTFYDGPPFATGLPHYGHILAGTIKDIVTRWAHQSGYHVERRFGWDTHGLPVEYEIDKTLDIKGPADVAKMGIAAYNAECRKIVMRYSNEWKTTVQRLGRWIDFDNDYKTLYPSFMESVWWVFKQLYNKGLVYRGVKVMPYSTRCSTPLSNFESGQNYRDVQDPAVTVSFPLDDEPDASLVAWTTTPWTLPSNLAVCLHPDLIYVKIKEVSSGKKYILMEARVPALFPKPQDYEVLEKFPGKQLKGRTYKPLFDYFASWKSRGAFQVLNDTYVTSESGTGIVHQAPYFGEDDYRVCLAAGIIRKDGELVCPIDASGIFTDPVSHFKGQYVKDADKNIIKHLKDAGRLVKVSTVEHSYPFCWRSDTPLIYRAVPSLFIRVEQMTEKLLANNESTYWVPEFVKDKRFANWLRDAHDWAVSRNRYWGTPIPLWVSDDGEEVVCVGSIQELADLSGVHVTDLHRESVDGITIKSVRGKGDLKRVPEVFDCWFESGSMPYAQVHYPFENKKAFEDGFPADFIAEGVDQTRGWFYTLLVISTALFDKPPFKNLIVNGLVLAADGQKMSKSKKNYPDPKLVVDSFGADALRLYLINSPVVRAETLKFKEDGVRDVLKDVFLPWYNAFRFLIQNIGVYCQENSETFVFNPLDVQSSSNVMDQWIMSFTQSLLQFVRQEMKAYRLYTVVPRLIKFVDNLTNWYVRMNRKRLKGDGGKQDARVALETLFSVLFNMIQIMSPFCPFLCEFMYQKLMFLLVDDPTVRAESVHHLMLPEVQATFIDKDVERKVSQMQTVIEIGRLVRDRVTLPLKHPLHEIVVISRNEDVLQDVTGLQEYILSELNIRTITVSTDRQKYGVSLKAIPDIKALGVRLKKESKSVVAAIRNLTEEQLLEYQKDPENFTVSGVKLEEGELKIQFSVGEQQSSSYAAHAEGDILVLLDVKPDASLVEEGLAREVVNRVQKLRKKADLVPTDVVSVYYGITGNDATDKSVVAFNEYISSALKAPFKSLPVESGKKIIIQEKLPLKDALLEIVITS